MHHAHSLKATSHAVTLQCGTSHLRPSWYLACVLTIPSHAAAQVNLFEDTNLCAIHAKRVTIM